jgi:hypothetical protein
MTRTTSDVLADRVIDWGVRVIFGLPGDGINGIMEALRKRQPTARFQSIFKSRKSARTRNHRRRSRVTPRMSGVRRLSSPAVRTYAPHAKSTLHLLLPAIRRREDRSFLERGQAGMVEWRKLMDTRSTRGD